MDKVVEIVAKDKSVRELSVFLHSNPTGETYSKETVIRLLNCLRWGIGFYDFYDNAYSVHDFIESPKLLNISNNVKV